MTNPKAKAEKLSRELMFHATTLAMNYNTSRKRTMSEIEKDVSEWSRLTAEDLVRRKVV